MYAPFFGLQSEPFSIAPDPRLLFMSERHREALAHLLYGLGGGGGFVLLTGEIGTGKTTVCRCFLEQIPRRCNVAYIFNPKLTVTELLRTVCDEFGIPVAHQGPGVATVKDYIDPLNEFLLKTHAVGQNNVLIIDEAQNLSPDVLEQLRLLTNLETNERKLLQIVLIGQPELRQMLARPELEQLAQRVIARFHLEALDAKETEAYIRHRLAMAGLAKAMPFDRAAMQRVHRLTGGVPRRINLLCDRALLGAYATGSATVDRRILDQAASEVFDTGLPRERGTALRRPGGLVGAGVLAGAVLAGAAVWALAPAPGDTRVASAAAPAASAARPAASGASAPTPRASAAPASAPASTPAPPTIVRHEAAPADAKPFRSEPDAWRALAAAWQAEIGAEADPCSAAVRHDLHCWRSPRSSLAVIRQLGRPGIVTLRDAGGGSTYAVLTGLTAQEATLRLGDATRTLALPALAEQWRGDFATFWRAPPGWRGRIAEGDSGPAVDWLAQQLDRLQAAPGAGLKARIHAFQLAQGLEADGLAGPVTFMQLNRAAGIDEPRLRSER